MLVQKLEERIVKGTICWTKGTPYSVKHVEPTRECAFFMKSQSVADVRGVGGVADPLQ